MALARASAGIAVDLAQTGVNIGDTLGISGGLRLGHERGHFHIRGHHQLDQGRVDLRRFLRHKSKPGAAAGADRGVRLADLLADEAEQGRLAGSVAPDQAHLPTLGDERIGVLEERARPDAISQV